MASRTHPNTVLILAGQAMAAAPLGMLLELEGYEPAYAREGESPEAALARVRPLLVVLVDHALDVSKSDLFLARAARRQVGIVLFGTDTTSGVGPPGWFIPPSLTSPDSAAGRRWRRA